MSYSEFSLARIKKEFQITVIEKVGLFDNLPTEKCSAYLTETLAYNVPLATSNNTEKARSELIVSPILVEARKHQEQFNFFSGTKFDVDESKGLNGFCDFIVTFSEERLYITAPVFMLVEAKNENINGGFGQCIAEMVAAQIFNNQENNSIKTIWGAVTSGTNWQFLKLENNTVELDLKDYYLHDIEKILGFLTFPCQSFENNLQAA